MTNLCEVSMEKSKKRICLVTNWYPTKENPYAGSFFKEQAFAMAEDFDFIVVHCTDCSKIKSPRYWLNGLLGRNLHVEKINVEGNTVEYTVDFQLPWYAVLEQRLYAFKRGTVRKDSPRYLRKKRAVIEKVCRTHFADAFDVVYCVSGQKESSTAQYVANALNLPYVVSEHAPFPWPGSLLHSAEKEAIQQADTFLAISYDKIRQVMMQDIQFKNITYVGNMVDETQFVLGSGSGAEKTFVMVAAHTFYKNYPLFIKIFNRLTQITDVPFKVMVVGYNANKGYSQNAQELEQKLSASAFADKLELIPAVSRDEIHKVYDRADAFVMTSVQEGMPVSALEAGCCGLPIFSTMCGGVEDYVDDSIGRIFKIVDCESFAQGLKAYLEGEIIFDREHIRQQVISQFGRDAFIRNITSAFYDVIARNEH